MYVFEGPVWLGAVIVTALEKVCPGRVRRRSGSSWSNY